MADVTMVTLVPELGDLNPWQRDRRIERHKPKRWR
jgi:hypothetical protein